jgi:hypothetical protein
MRMIAYWAPKSATPEAEWEDGAAYSRRTGRFAIADGASAGSGSREWAYTLVRDFVATGGALTNFDSWLAATRAGFDPRSAEFPPPRVPDWVRASNEHTGAYATFLGAHLESARLRAVAVGDCCLFHVTATGVRTFPLASASDFGSQPSLVASRADASAPALTYQADLAPADVVLAATDALAQWVLTDIAANLPVLLGIGHRGFRDLCGDLRAGRHMRDDDVTLLRAAIGRGGTG